MVKDFCNVDLQFNYIDILPESQKSLYIGREGGKSEGISGTKTNKRDEHFVHCLGVPCSR